MNVHRRVVGLDEPQQILVILDRQRVIHPTLHENLRSPDRDQLAYFLADLLVGQRIAVDIFMIAPKRAERAFGRADVGVVDVPVDDVGAVILWMEPLRNSGCPFAQILQGRMRVKLNRLRLGEPGFALDKRINVKRQLSHIWGSLGNQTGDRQV